MQGTQTPFIVDLEDGMALRHPEDFDLGEILAVAGVEGEAILAFRVGLRDSSADFNGLVFLTGPESFRLFRSDGHDYFPTEALAVTSQFSFGIEDLAPTSSRLPAPGRVVTCPSPGPVLSVPVRRHHGEVIVAFAILAGPLKGHLIRPEEACSNIGRLVVRPIDAARLRTAW